MEISNPRSQIQFHLHPSPPLLQQQPQPQPPPLQFGLKKTEDNKELYVLYNEDDTDFTQHASFVIPLHGPELDPLNKILHVVGTCNGLLCLSDYSLKSDRIFLWNPCVGKYLRLPSPNVTYTTHGVFKGSLGFGFDLKTNDYKVVRVVRFPITPNLPTLQQKVEVYSLSTGQWRTLRDSLVPTCGILTQSSVNVAMHWLVSRTANDNQFDHFGLVFDLHNEVFREIMLPELPAYTRQRSTLCASISIYRNSIALFHDDHNSLCLDIWVMKDYGVVSSWMKAQFTLKKEHNEGSRVLQEWSHCVGIGWWTTHIMGFRDPRDQGFWDYWV